MKRASRSKTRKVQLVVGIDLGGTNMQIGVVTAANKIIGRHRRKTLARDGHKKVIQRICEGVKVACDDAGVSLNDIAVVGIAAPGAIDIPRGIVLEAPNLKWRNLPLRNMLQTKLGRPVVVDNDVNGAVWGERHLGAGRKSRISKSIQVEKGDVLGVWLGTGVGGGLVIGNQLFHGEFFTAGEIGQTVLFPNGKKGRRTVEDFCSRTGVSRTIQLRLSSYPKSLLHEITTGAGTITGSKQLAKAYRRKDKLAVEVVNEAADLLGIAIANWITVLAMNTVIIGGGMTEALGKSFVNRVRTSFKRNVFPNRCQNAKLLMTKLQDDAGLLGAALLAREACRLND